MKVEVWWFLEDIWRQYKVQKIHLKFQGIARWKNTLKRVEKCWIHIGEAASSTPKRESMCRAHGTTIITAPCTPAHQTMRLAHGHGHEVLFSCFSSRFWLKNPIFTLLTPKLSCTINRDPFKLFYSFRNIAKQVKGQASRASR